jgi:hypothetical protein
MVLALFTGVLSAADSPRPPVVEVEEDVYSFEPADNGAGPMWCRGSTCLVRVGDDVFASGLETIRDAKPLNNCRWMLFHRGPQGWKRVRTDATGRTREPAPLAVLPGGRVFLSANPTLVSDPQAYAGPARPEVLEFAVSDPAGAPKTHLPVWDGEPKFTEHSYRSFAADGPAGELILFQNIDYTHAEWSFRDREGRWSAQARLKWPWGAEYAKPQPIRVCYPNVALRNRAVHFCGVSDIVEPNPAWREFKKQLTGREWDYDFRRLFYTWTPDVTKTPFAPWVEIASRETTCGWIMPEDLWVAPDGAVFVLWTERAIDERLRAKFFPDAKQSHALNLAVLRDGKVARRQTLLEAREGESGETPGAARFHVTPDNQLWVISYVNGTDKSGTAVSENRLIAIDAKGNAGSSVGLPLKKPFTSFFTATVRAGSAPSAWLDLLGHQAGQSQTLSYARIRMP